MTLQEVISLFSRYVHRINDIDVVQMCGLAAGTGTMTVQTTNAIVYQLYNQQYTLAATDNIDISVVATQTLDTFCYYLLSVDDSGTITVTKGTENAYALPTTPAGTVAFAAFKMTYVSPGGMGNVTVVYYDIDTGIATSLINQAQRKIEQGVTVNMNGFPLRVSNWDHMKVRTEITISQGDEILTNPIPNYKEFVYAQLTDTNGYTYPPLSKEDRRIPGLTTQSRPFKIARLPNNEATLNPDIIPTQDFQLWPQSDATYTLDLVCYQYSPTLDGVVYSTNWWTQNMPEALVMGALIEAEAYLKQDERMNTWKERLDGILAALAGNQMDEQWAGATINIKFYDPFKRTIGNIYSYAGGR